MATALLLVAEHRFSDADSVFVYLEYDTVTLAVDAVVIDNEFGHTIVATATSPTQQQFTRTFTQAGLGLRIPVSFTLGTNVYKGVSYPGLPAGWSLVVEVT
jgi:hypothetical protein